MNKDDYIALIYKNLKREISPDEQKQLNKWAKEKDHAELKHQVEQNWQLSKEALPPIAIDTKKDFQDFRKKMRQHTTAATKKPTPKEAIVKPINWLRRGLSIAAAIALPLLAAWWVLGPSTTSTQMTIAQTSVGETKAIVLEDGTEITLNENSELSYPATFSSTLRNVELKGEAYFDVQSDPTRPFEVHTNKATVKVLGTVFNVRSIETEPAIKVTVEEGKVQLSSKETTQSVILTKGESGSYHYSTKQLTENKVNNSNAIAWKNKVLTYKNAPLKEVIKDLEEQFKITTSIQEDKMKECLVTARFTKATPKKVLDYIVQLYNMELKEIDSESYELANGICK